MCVGVTAQDIFNRCLSYRHTDMLQLIMFICCVCYVMYLALVRISMLYKFIAMIVSNRVALIFK